jgi:hypothetical protein
LRNSETQLTKDENQKKNSVSIQINRSSSILTARIDKVIIFFYYPNNAHTNEILKGDRISNDLKKCFNNKIKML